MSTPDLPPAIKVVRDSMSVTRYVLPKRDLGAARKFGWIPAVAGLFITGFMFFWMRGAMSDCFSAHGFGFWFGIVFGLMGLPGLAAGLGFLALGVVILTNASHTEIVVGDGTLCAIERIGILPIRRKRFISDIRQIIIQNGGITVSDENNRTTKTYAPELSILIAATSAKPLWLAPAYPHDLLRPLADTLAASLSLAAPTTATADRDPAVEVVEVDAGSEPADLSVPKPEGTDITCQSGPHGLAISVPAQGLVKGSKGMFVFGVVWIAFIAFFTTMVTKGHAPLPVYLFISLFWAIGIGILLGAINMARRKVLIAVVNNTIACRIMGPFGTREQKVPLAVVDTIRVGPSGMKVNDRPVMELQIIPKTGRKIGLLSNRSEAEQNWLAYTLRQTLRRTP